MSTLAFSTPRALRGFLAAGFVAVSLVSVMAVAHAEQTSAEFSEKYNAGVQAYKGKDMAKALQSAKDARSVAKSNFEKAAALKLIVATSGGAGKYQDSAEALEQLLAMDSVSAAEKTQFHKSLASVDAQINRLDKALAEEKEYIKASGGSPADYEVLAQLYSANKDCANALASLDKALTGGKQPSEPQLKLQGRCYFQMKNNDKLLAVNEEALRRFPKKEYYNQVLAIYQEKKIDDLAMLAMLRYGYDRDYLDSEGDYLKLADRALDVGTTAEAQRVLEKGVAKKIIKNVEKSDKLLKQAKDRAVEDVKNLAQLDAEARAGKNGDTDARLGLRYYSVGQFDKAVEALNRALSAERVARVRRPDDASMVLGVCYTKLKKSAEAAKAFNVAKADPRMTAAAKMWLGAA
jgi:tetratricopeptide (TPR) repeat protein